MSKTDHYNDNAHEQVLSDGHFHEKKGTCEGCKKDVLSKYVTVSNNKYYHTECFICSNCNREIKTKKISFY